MISLLRKIGRQEFRQTYCVLSQKQGNKGNITVENISVSPQLNVVHNTQRQCKRRASQQINTYMLKIKKVILEEYL